MLCFKSAEGVDCRYFFDETLGYSCEIVEAVITEWGDDVTFIGEHVGGRSNADVLHVNASNSVLFYVPPKLFETFPNLEVLVLHSVQLETVSKEEFAVCSLQRLSLSYNSLQELPESSFGSCNKLTDVYLKSNHISAIHDDAFLGLAAIETLSLADNGLREIRPDVFKPLTNLKNLVLSLNNLTTMPDFRKDKLEQFLLDYNQFVQLPAGFFETATNLAGLFLSNNKINSIDSQLLQPLTGLETLELNNNLIASIDAQAFSSLKNVWHLRLDDNQLVNLDVNLFSEMENLTQMDLSGNQISTLHPELFKSTQKLKILDLSGNMIQTIADGLFPASLERLQINSNRLISLSPGWLSPLTNLLVISADLNRITALQPKMFESNKNLQSLSLQVNELTILQADFFDSIPQLKILLLIANKIYGIERNIFQALPNLWNFHLGNNNCTVYNFNTLVPNTPIDFTPYLQYLQTCFDNFDLWAQRQDSSTVPTTSTAQQESSATAPTTSTTQQTSSQPTETTTGTAALFVLSQSLILVVLVQFLI